MIKKKIKSTKLHIHLFQALPACAHPVVFLILYHTAVVLKFQIISVFILKVVFWQCFPGPPYPDLNSFLFCSAGTSGSLRSTVGNGLMLGKSFFFFNSIIDLYHLPYSPICKDLTTFCLFPQYYHQNSCGSNLVTVPQQVALYLNHKTRALLLLLMKNPTSATGVESISSQPSFGVCILIHFWSVACLFY